MLTGLDEIRSGAFAEEWEKEYGAGYPTLESLRNIAKATPLYQWECDLRKAMRGNLGYQLARDQLEPSLTEDSIGKSRGFRRFWNRFIGKGERSLLNIPLKKDQITPVLQFFLNYLGVSSSFIPYTH